MWINVQSYRINDLMPDMTFIIRGYIHGRFKLLDDMDKFIILKL